jgi:hypothetical protein
VEQTLKEAGAAAHGVKGFLMEKPDGLLTDNYEVGDVARVVVGAKTESLHQSN